MADELGGAPSNGAADGGAISDAGAAPAVSGVSDGQAPQGQPSGSTREALEKAFASVNEPSGDSGVAGDKPAADRARDEAGRFAKAAADAAAGIAPVDPAKALQAAQDPKPAPVAGAAPAGFTKAAQEAWAATPDAVRADVERRMGELTQGMEKYKGDAAAFNEVREFADLAKQTGTTLKEAMTNYVSIDKKLQGGDFVGGMFQIFQNLGLDGRAAVTQLVNAVNGQGAQVPAGSASPEVAALKQTIAALEKRLDTEVGGVKQTLSQRDSMEAVTKFAADHPYFDELTDPIVKMIETGFASDLSDAYEKAVRLTPEIAAKIEADKKPKPDPAQTQAKARLSITGTPAAASYAATEKPAGSTREALARAAAQVGLSF